MDGDVEARLRVLEQVIGLLLSHRSDKDANQIISSGDHAAHALADIARNNPELSWAVLQRLYHLVERAPVMRLEYELRSGLESYQRRVRDLEELLAAYAAAEAMGLDSKQVALHRYCLSVPGLV
jgi:hypothetical protein